jgi:electron transport complex protein RnfC
MPTPIPELLLLPLSQNREADAIPVVNVGERVLKFQLLAEPGEPQGTALHAPTSGRISSISMAPVTIESSSPRLCMHLQTDGVDAAIDVEAEADYRALGHLQLLEKIELAGICGLGGAGFATARKLSLSINQGVDLLIINAAECEPYISADEALLRERAVDVVSGADILQSISLAKRCVIAIAEDKEDAIETLVAALKTSSIELITLASKYPAGGEKQIIQAVSGMQTPSNQHPPSIGVLVHNVGTAYAVYRAVVCGEPCISRITTLTGAPLQTPKNFETLIGTPVSFLFDLCGIDSAIHTGSIVGGSLMGIKLLNLDVPVLKTSNCLIAMSASEFPAAAPELACIRCGYCATACPARLLPQQLYAFSRSQNHQQIEDHGLFDCIECGACAYVCPSSIPLVQYYRTSKQEIRQLQASQQQSLRWQTRFQQHQYRIKLQQEQIQHHKPVSIDMDSIDKQADSEETGQQATSEIPKASFSRELAQQEIADAVARVRARKSGVIASSNNNENGS